MYFKLINVTKYYIIAIERNWIKKMVVDYLYLRRFIVLEIKRIEKADYHILEDFIYWAIFVPTGTKLPEKSIIFNPNVFIYIENYGNENDCGVFAEIDGKAVG